MGVTCTTTPTSPFRPLCPSYFNLSRSCPCFASRAASSRPFSVALHRFLGEIPLRVIDGRQRRDEKRMVVSRIYTPPGFEVTTIPCDGTRALWKQKKY